MRISEVICDICRTPLYFLQITVINADEDFSDNPWYLWEDTSIGFCSNLKGYNKVLWLLKAYYN